MSEFRNPDLLGGAPVIKLVRGDQLMVGHSVLTVREVGDGSVRVHVDAPKQPIALKSRGKVRVGAVHASKKS